MALVVTCFTFCNFTVLKKIYKFKSCDLNLHTGSTNQFWFFFSKYFYFEPETLLPYWHEGQLVGGSSGQTRKCRWKNELKNTHRGHTLQTGYHFQCQFAGRLTLHRLVVFRYQHQTYQRVWKIAQLIWICVLTFFFEVLNLLSVIKGLLLLHCF